MCNRHIVVNGNTIKNVRKRNTPVTPEIGADRYFRRRHFFVKMASPKTPYGSVGKRRKRRQTLPTSTEKTGNRCTASIDGYPEATDGQQVRAGARERPLFGQNVPRVLLDVTVKRSVYTVYKIHGR